MLTPTRRHVLTTGLAAALPLGPAHAIDFGPADLARLGGIWSFENGTPRLTVDNFRRTFEIGFAGGVNPLTWVMFGIGQATLRGGSCFGMCLGVAMMGNAEHAQGNFGAGGTLLRQRWQNPLWDTRPIADDALRERIGFLHWKQLSAGYVRAYLASVAQTIAGEIVGSPTSLVERIARDSVNRRFGIIPIMDTGLTGHVLLPYNAGALSGPRSGLIPVYDPNRPSRDPYANGIVIDGLRWSYRQSLGADGRAFTGDDTVWSGGPTSIAYIPYADITRNGWNELVTSPGGLLTVAFGAGAEVEQVTDRGGRRLFQKDGGAGGGLDHSAKGLGGSLAPLPAIKERARAKQSAWLTPELVAEIAREADGVDIQELERLLPAFGDHRQVFLAHAPDLQDLTFHVRTAGKQAPRAEILIGDKRQALSLSLQSSKAMRLEVRLPSSARPLEGLAIRDLGGAELNVDVRRTLQGETGQRVVREKAAGLRVASAPLTLHGAPSADLRVGGAAGAARLEKLEVQPGRVLRNLGARDLRIER